MGINLHCYVTKGIATNSKAIASYTQTVMKFDTKGQVLASKINVFLLACLCACHSPYMVELQPKVHQKPFKCLLVVF